MLGNVRPRAGLMGRGTPGFSGCSVLHLPKLGVVSEFYHLGNNELLGEKDLEEEEVVRSINKV